MLKISHKPVRRTYSFNQPKAGEPTIELGESARFGDFTPEDFVRVEEILEILSLEEFRRMVGFKNKGEAGSEKSLAAIILSAQDEVGGRRHLLSEEELDSPAMDAFKGNQELIAKFLMDMWKDIHSLDSDLTIEEIIGERVRRTKKLFSLFPVAVSRNTIYFDVGANEFRFIYCPIPPKYSSGTIDGDRYHHETFYDFEARDEKGRIEQSRVKAVLCSIAQIAAMLFLGGYPEELNTWTIDRAEVLFGVVNKCLDQQEEAAVTVGLRKLFRYLLCRDDLVTSEEMLQDPGIADVAAYLGKHDITWKHDECKREQFLSEIVQRGDYNYRDPKTNENVLHLAANLVLSSVELFKHPDARELLFLKDSEGYTPLHRLILNRKKHSGNIENTKAILKAIWHHAAKDRKWSATFFMRESLLNIPDPQGQTALHLAIKEGVFYSGFDRAKIIRLLLQAGANPFVQDNNGKMFIHLREWKEGVGALGDEVICLMFVDRLGDVLKSSDGDVGVSEAVIFDSKKFKNPENCEMIHNMFLRDNAHIHLSHHSMKL